MFEHCVGLVVEVELFHQRGRQPQLVGVCSGRRSRSSKPLDGGDRGRAIALRKSQPRLERDHSGRRRLTAGQGFELGCGLVQFAVADQLFHDRGQHRRGCLRLCRDRQHVLSAFLPTAGPLEQLGPLRPLWLGERPPLSERREKRERLLPGLGLRPAGENPNTECHVFDRRFSIAVLGASELCHSLFDLAVGSVTRG